MEWAITNSLFTWLLPLASLPIIFHLFFKLKKKSRVFPTLMLFVEIDPKLSARRQIRQWIVLLLRVLFILLLMLALARPTWLIGGGGGNVAVVLVIDNSGSMQAKLRTAIEAAHALVSNLRAGDLAGITMLVDDPAVTLPEGLSADKAQVMTALDRLVETEATGEPGRALGKAFAMLEGASATRFEVHLFTDLQETEWNKAAADLRKPRAGTSLAIHRFPTATETQPNVAVTGTELPRQRLLVGRQTPVGVSLANFSALDADVRLNWADDAGNKGTLDVAAPKQSEKTVPLLTTPAAPGFHWLNVWLEGDSFEPDNKTGIGFVSADKAPVLFVGDVSQFGFLPLALSPAAEGALSGLVPVFSLTGELPNPKPALVVVSANRAAAFQKYVADGGNLLVLPATASQTDPKGAPVLVLNKKARLLAELRDEKGEVPFRGVKAFQFSPVQLAPGADAVLGLENGQVLLAEHRVGKGNIFTSGLAFDPNWSTLPLKGGFLAIVQSMALMHDTTADNTISMVAGERLARVTGDGEAVHIKSLVGSPLDWKGERARLPVLARAGVYAVTAGKETTYVAVRASDKEGIAKFITTEKVPALAELAYTVQNFQGLDKFLKETRKVRRGVDVFLPLLLLSLLALLLEAWLANPLQRKMKRPEAQPRVPAGAT